MILFTLFPKEAKSTKVCTALLGKTSTLKIITRKKKAKQKKCRGERESKISKIYTQSENPDHKDEIFLKVVFHKKYNSDSSFLCFKFCEGVVVGLS